MANFIKCTSSSDGHYKSDGDLVRWKITSDASILWIAWSLIVQLYYQSLPKWPVIYLQLLFFIIKVSIWSLRSHAWNLIHHFITSTNSYFTLSDAEDWTARVDHLIKRSVANQILLTYLKNFFLDDPFGR